MEEKRIEIKNKSYVIKNEIASGAQKKVLLCIDESNKNVIIKEAKFNQLIDIERVFREAMFLKQFNSVYLPKMIDHDIFIEKKIYYIVEEYIQGAELEEKKSLFNTENSIIKLIYHIILGLKDIWEEGVVHRDLKFENILIRDNNNLPVIIDFGIARFFGKTSLTRLSDSIIPHTPGFAAPEVLKGESDLISMRTDFFSIGVIAHILLSNKHPYQLDNEYTLEQNIKLGLYEITDCSKEFRKLILKLIAPEPFKRFKRGDSILKYIEKHFRGDIL